MTQDDIFVISHRKAMGEETAKKMLADAKKNQPKDDEHTEVWLDIYGNEHHPNGDVEEALYPGETLQQKIRRFDELSARVAAIRMARLAGMIPTPEDDEDDEDPSDDSLLDDVVEKDDFGEVIQPAKKKKVVVEDNPNDDVKTVVAGDEPANGADGSASAVMASDE